MATSNRQTELLKKLRKSNDPVLRDFSSPLFELPERLDVSMLPSFEEADAEFRLPFPSVCLSFEDEESSMLVTLEDTEPEQFGLKAKRKFAIAVTHDQYCDTTFLLFGVVVGSRELAAMLSANKPDRVVGFEHLFEEGTEEQVQVAVTGLARLVGGRVIHGRNDGTEEELRSFAEAADRYVTESLRFLSLLLSTKFVVVERTPMLRNPKAKVGAALRRRRYTILHVTEARKLLVGSNKQESPEEKRVVAAGLRRGCYHELRHEKYRRNPDGSVRRVWWKSCWVGPAEATTGDRRYRVLLNLDKRSTDKPCEEVATPGEET